jgi:hypothetical protein
LRSHLPRALAGILLAAALLATPASASQSTQAPAGFFGIGDWAYPTDTQSSALAAAGLRLVRAALVWGNVQSSADAASRNWSQSDALARRAARDGYALLFDLSGCAVWACGTVDAPPSGATLTEYESFVSAAVARYGPGSSFWAGQAHVPQITWQVWNEVNGGYFWPNPTPATYAAFLAQITHTIRAVDAQAPVIMSGLVELPSVSSGMALTPFLAGLYAQPGFTASTDAIAVHGYAADPASSVHILDEARRVMLEHGDAARPLWVTEMSWATSGPPFPFTVTAAQQSAYLAQSWQTLLECRSRWNLVHVLWFPLQDVGGTVFGQPDGWYFHNGLLNPDGSAKPAYATFLQFLGSSPPGAAVAGCPLPGGYTLDITDPLPRILSAPLATRDTTRAIVTFTASEKGLAVAGMHYQCSLDETPWTACSSPLNVASTREGQHTLLVQAIDPEGNVDATPAQVSWLVDLTAPDTVISSRARHAHRGVLRVSFSGVDAGGVARFQCRVDGGAWRRCRSPYRTRRLARGVHVVEVRAIDRAGNVDPSPAGESFRIRR